MSNFRDSAAARAYFEVQAMAPADKRWRQPAKTRPMFADSPRGSLAVAIALVIGCAAVVILLTLGK